MHLLVGRYVEARPAGLRWRAAQLIGTCSQNVAAIQEQALGLGALRKLLRLLDRDACDSVRVKALFAISCECWAAGEGHGFLRAGASRWRWALLGLPEAEGEGPCLLVYSQYWTRFWPGCGNSLPSPCYSVSQILGT